MKAEVLNEFVTLYEGDNAEVLASYPNGAFDAVVTSPPYNLNKKHSGGGVNDTMRLKQKYEEEWYADEMPEPEYQAWQRSVVAECLRVCRGSVFYNHKPRYAWNKRNTYRPPANAYHPWDWLSGFPLWCEIVWDRGGVGSPNAGRYPTADERVYQLGKPKVWKPQIGWSSVWRITPARSEHGHPCPFPDELVRRCILPCTDEGDTILDPFAGSGTTAIACMGEKRKCVLIEKDAEFCDIIRERVANADGRGKGQLFSQLEFT